MTSAPTTRTVMVTVDDLQECLANRLTPVREEVDSTLGSTALE